MQSTEDLLGVLRYREEQLTQEKQRIEFELQEIRFKIYTLKDQLGIV